MKEIEEIMKSLSIEFKSWPQEIKYNFKELINQTSDTRIIELKKEIENNYLSINQIFKELAFIKIKSKNWKDEGKYISFYSNKIMENLSLSILPFKICNEQEKFLNTNNDNRNKLESINKAETYIFKNKIESCIHAGLSFINLFWNIYALRQTIKDVNFITECKSNLDKIINDFKLHQKLIGILPDNLEEAQKHILKISDLIQTDLKKLKLIDDISKEIKFQESQKCKSIIHIISDLGFGTFGFVGTFLTGGLTAILYGTSSLLNVISFTIDLKNFSDSSNCIKQYKEIKEMLMKKKKNLKFSYIN